MGLFGLTWFTRNKMGDDNQENLELQNNEQDIQPQAQEDHHPQDAREGNLGYWNDFQENFPDIVKQFSINFNGSRGFLNYYGLFAKENRRLPLYRSYELACEIYGSLSPNKKDAYRQMKSLVVTREQRDRAKFEDGYAGMDCDGTFLLDEKDFHMSDGCCGPCPPPKCVCGRECPTKRARSTCIEPGTCDSIGFKNFLAAFRCKNDQYSRCSGLAVAQYIYSGLNDGEKRAYRAQGCIPPRCRKSCIRFYPITNAKRRPKCKPCGF